MTVCQTKHNTSSVMISCAFFQPRHLLNRQLILASESMISPCAIYTKSIPFAKNSRKRALAISLLPSCHVEYSSERYIGAPSIVRTCCSLTLKGLFSSHSIILRQITSSLVASANTPHEACSIFPSCLRQSAFSRPDTSPQLLCFSCPIDIFPCSSPSFLYGFNQKQRPSNLNEIRRSS